MELVVWTARISYRGDDRLDITWKSSGAAGRPFAPSYPILADALARRDDAKDLRARGLHLEADEEEARAWAEYEPRYVEEMRRSYRYRRDAWDALGALEEVTLVCYCARPERCHRGLLAGILAKLGAVYRGERVGGRAGPPRELGDHVRLSTRPGGSCVISRGRGR